MDGDTQPKNSSKKGRTEERWPRIAAIALIVAVVVIALLYALPTTRNQVRGWYRALMSMPANSQEAHGNLYLTTGKDNTITAAFLDVKTGELMNRSLDGDRALEWMTVSPAGDKRAYFLRKTTTEPAEIRVYTEATGDRAVVLSPAPETARSLHWSPDGKTLAFSAREVDPSSDSDIAASDWAIYTVPVSGGAMTRITSGVSPFFSPDGAILFALKDDGLYAISLADHSERIVRSMQGGQAHRFMDVDVSPDGTKLLWSNPLSNNRVGKLFIFDILSWSPITISEVAHVVEMPARNAVFSPDSKYVAYLTNPASESGVNAGVYVLDLKDFAPHLLLDLAGFNLSSTALTDWR